VPAVVDDFCRECVALVVDNSRSGFRVARELDRAIEIRGTPSIVVSDNGTELTSCAILAWQEERGVEWRYFAPGKRTQNGFIESFNGASMNGVFKPRPLPHTNHRNGTRRHAFLQSL
jgi:putative transposase